MIQKKKLAHKRKENNKSILITRVYDAKQKPMQLSERIRYGYV